MPVSVLILTRNDEQDISGCLESAGCSDDIHVLDSSSEDRTIEIARASGANVTQRSHEGNDLHGATLKGLGFKNAWVLILEAKDRITRGLEAELSLVEFHSGEEMAYRITKREISAGKPVKRSRANSSPIRLLRWSSVADRKEVGEGIARDGAVGELEAPFDHCCGEGGASVQAACLRDRMSQVLTWTAGITLIGLVFFFSWLPSPRLSEQIPMPAFIGAWVDAGRNENFRTAVPFVLLGLVVGRALEKVSAGWPIWLWAWSGMIVAAGLAEGGQNFLPARRCDPRDIAWAAAGGAAGLLLMYANGRTRRFARRIRPGSVTSPV